MVPKKRLFLLRIIFQASVFQLKKLVFDFQTLNPVPSGKLTCPLKIHGWKMYFLLKQSLFRGYVSFREGITKIVGRLVRPFWGRKFFSITETCFGTRQKSKSYVNTIKFKHMFTKNILDGRSTFFRWHRKKTNSTKRNSAKEKNTGSNSRHFLRHLTKLTPSNHPKKTHKPHLTAAIERQNWTNGGSAIASSSGTSTEFTTYQLMEEKSHQ